MGHATADDIVSNQTAAPAAASPTTPLANHGRASFDDIASNDTLNPPAVKPPADYLTKTEDTIQSATQGVGEAASDIWGVAKGAVKSAVKDAVLGPAVTSGLEISDAVKQTLPIINAYENARSSGASITDAIKASDAAARQHIKNIAPIDKLVAAFKANPTQETARALTDATALAASMLIPGGVEAGAGDAGIFPPEAAARFNKLVAPEAEAAAPVSKLRINPFRAAVTKPLATPEAAGDAAVQPIAQAGIRTVAQPVGASFRSGIDVETPLGQAKNLYRTVDEAAKTDFKGLYDKLDAAQDEARLAAPGSSEEAKAQLNIKNTQDAIDDAKKVAVNSGVPDIDKTLKQADAKFAETQANKDLNSKFFGNNGVISGNVAHGAPEKINVDSGIKVLENMDKPNKYGLSRLQQTSLGTDGAQKLKQVLYDAQKAGQAYMDARSLRNKVIAWGIPSVTGALGLAYELAK